MLVEDSVICELKKALIIRNDKSLAVETMNPVIMAQLLTQLKLTGKRLGFLINFNVPRIKDGLQRVVLSSSCLRVFVVNQRWGFLLRIFRKRKDLTIGIYTTVGKYL